MDLTAVREVVDGRSTLPWEPGEAWLAGGTALFAEPRADLWRLRDLSRCGWPPLTVTEDGLEVAATCTISDLLAFARAPGQPWPRTRKLIADCCRAFSSSFKVWNTATVGGNVCLALPAGPMISLAVALDGMCQVRGRGGRRSRVPVTDFVTGPGRTVLRPGDLLRSLHLPAAALTRPVAWRRVSLRPLGRSAALVTGTHASDSGRTSIAVTAATIRPVVLTFDQPPPATVLHDALEDALEPGLIVEDVHGLPAWRRHLVFQLADEVRRALSRR